MQSQVKFNPSYTQYCAWACQPTHPYAWVLFMRSWKHTGGYFWSMLAPHTHPSLLDCTQWLNQLSLPHYLASQHQPPWQSSILLWPLDKAKHFERGRGGKLDISKNILLQEFIFVVGSEFWYNGGRFWYKFMSWSKCIGKYLGRRCNSKWTLQKVTQYGMEGAWPSRGWYNYHLMGFLLSGNRSCNECGKGYQRLM